MAVFVLSLSAGTVRAQTALTPAPQLRGEVDTARCDWRPGERFIARTCSSTALRERGGNPTQFVRNDAIRAGFRRPMADPGTLDSTNRARSGHRVKHAAVGAGIGVGAGLVIGAAIGWNIDHTRPGMIPATPIIAIEGAGIGLVAGLVIGALVP